MSTQKPAQVVAYGLTGGAGSAGMHTVLNGDTVYTVSKQYNLPMRDIIALNNLSAPYNLSQGYRIKLPPPNEYKVRRHDTLYGVASMFDSTVNEVARLNNLSAPYALTQGQVLRLPSPQNLQMASASAAPVVEEAVSARVEGVEREAIPQPPMKGRGAAGAVPGASVPPQPAAAQPASSPPPKIPDTVPPRAKGSGKFMWPVDGRVVSGYGPKSDGLHNDGINIKVPRGTPVRAADNGVVVYADDKIQGYGNLVLVRHADRWMTAYAHLDKALVKKGDTLRQGQTLGTVGSSGQVDSPQLHFEVRRGTEALNPQKYL